MYYVFREYWAGTMAIFDNEMDCMRFVKDFKHNCIENSEDGYCPVEEADYEVTKINGINLNYEIWEKTVDID